MNDSAIEQEIQAKGLNAPRVTPELIESRILGEHYFTAGEGVHGREMIEDGMSDASSTLTVCPLSRLTFCVITMRNGFTVTGESACASPENFDAEIGRKIARENAVNKVWMLEGYLLKEQLSNPAPQSMPS
jgi:hypothetical protein